MHVCDVFVTPGVMCQMFVLEFWTGNFCDFKKVRSNPWKLDSQLHPTIIMNPICLNVKWSHPKDIARVPCSNKHIVFQEPFFSMRSWNINGLKEHVQFAKKNMTWYCLHGQPRPYHIGSTKNRGFSLTKLAEWHGFLYMYSCGQAKHVFFQQNEDQHVFFCTA